MKLPATPNPNVSVVLRRSEWLILETFLVVHEMDPSDCPHMKLKLVQKRLEKIKVQIIKAEREAQFQILGDCLKTVALP